MYTSPSSEPPPFDFAWNKTQNTLHHLETKRNSIKKNKIRVYKDFDALEEQSLSGIDRGGGVGGNLCFMHEFSSSTRKSAFGAIIVDIDVEPRQRGNKDDDECNQGKIRTSCHLPMIAVECLASQSAWDWGLMGPEGRQQPSGVRW